MNLIKYLCLLIVVLFVAQITLAQTDDEPCKLILKNGLYKTFKFVRTGNFEKDLKTYFSSNTFKSDYNNREWGGDINVVAVIKGVPTPIGLKANSTNIQLDEFSQSITNAASLQITQSFYDFALTSIPDVALAQEYTNCLNSRFGFTTFIDIGESEVIFSIVYKKEFDKDPMPIIKTFAVVNGKILSGAVKTGNTIGNNQTIIIERVPDKDLVFSFETDKGGVSRRIPGGSAGFNKDLPLGTIIASYLTFDQFNAVTSNNINCPSSLWQARCSKWSPADGRLISLSKLSNLPSPLLGSVPDLRGVFLRGLNEFDPSSPTPQDNSRNDTDKTRKVGSYQEDEFKKHSHNISEESSEGGVRGKETLIKNSQREVPPRKTDDAGTANETRPKNIAVFYYIRIN